MTAVLAWESSNYAWNSFAHSVGAFVTSAGFAGLAAVIAALVAAWQVRKTREQDKTNRKTDRDAAENRQRLDDLWKRFEWVVDRSTPSGQGETAILSARRTATILESIRDTAKDLGDHHLHAMIQTYMDNELAAVARRIGL